MTSSSALGLVPTERIVVLGDGGGGELLRQADDADLPILLDFDSAGDAGLLYV